MYTPLDVEGFAEHPEYMSGHNLENRYNVTACWKGKTDNNSLMLMGHIDTVRTGDVSNWSINPFGGENRDGKIFGRGAADDKYALALIPFLIKLLKEAGFTPKANVFFGAYCDEEYGGSHGALASVLKYPCERILNIDGKQDELWHCATGGQDIEYSYHTQESVESAEQAGKAISIVLEIMEEFKNNRKRELEENKFYKGTEYAKVPMYCLEIRVGDDGNDLGIGKIVFEYFTDKTEKEIHTELEYFNEILSERLKPFGIISDGFRPLCRFFHYAYCDPDNDIVKDMLNAYDTVSGKKPTVCGSFLTDLSVLLKYGTDKAITLGISKGFGDEGGPHQNDEFVECDKLVEMAKIVAAYIVNTLS